MHYQNKRQSETLLRYGTLADFFNCHIVLFAMYIRVATYFMTVPISVHGPGQ